MPVAVSFLVFALIFQPLTGVVAAFYNRLPQIWHTLVVLMRPTVWLARAWNRFARRSVGSNEEPAANSPAGAGRTTE
jgi:hypothetical protein